MTSVDDISGQMVMKLLDLLGAQERPKLSWYRYEGPKIVVRIKLKAYFQNQVSGLKMMRMVMFFLQFAEWVAGISQLYLQLPTKYEFRTWAMRRNLIVSCIFSIN